MANDSTNTFQYALDPNKRAIARIDILKSRFDKESYNHLDSQIRLQKSKYQTSKDGYELVTKVFKLLSIVALITFVFISKSFLKNLTPEQLQFSVVTFLFLLILLTFSLFLFLFWWRNKINSLETVIQLMEDTLEEKDKDDRRVKR